jgi:hypothetical protein
MSSWALSRRGPELDEQQPERSALAKINALDVLYINALPHCRGVLCGCSSKLLSMWHCVEERVVIGSEAPQSHM